MAGSVQEEKVEIAVIDTPTTTPLNSVANCSLIDDCSNITVVDSYLEFERLKSIIVPVIFGVIVLLGLLGNLLVIVVIVSDKHMRNTTNILILSLAVADLLFILLCVPFTAAMFSMPVWPFGSIMCKVVQYMIYVCAYASVYTLVLMSLDRYLAVVHAIRSMSIRNEFNTWLAIAVTWTVIFLGHIPLLVEYDIHHYQHLDQNRTFCTNVAHLDNITLAKIFYGSFFAFGYVIPLSAVCLMYGLMLKRLLYGVVPGGNQSQESIRAKKRVTRMVIIVVIMFALCWLPIQIIFVIQRFGNYPTSMEFFGLQVASNCLAYMNSCVNPFLYAFLSENFRRSFQKFLCCITPSSRRMDYERTNIRYSEKESKSTHLSRTANNV
ncbi:hypothetical protein C0Q70_01525 [Pomacea canaliculata]|uniref:G-protein coupled receptors family 1 profile domain-containing protein n=3 Tax=Pomacea canaliculata TaxID=400727 RepID=A0A2T7PZS6_POMCA|nr:hypothetical protein C0Q70_01525 [Pomacea canaliculata]